MTETEWGSCSDPTKMLQWLRQRMLKWSPGSPPGITDRKYRLFVCAVCRSQWHLFEEERSRRAVETGEWLADGKAMEEERASIASSIANRAGVVWRDGLRVASLRLSAFCVNANANASDAVDGIIGLLGGEPEAALLREIVNPFVVLPGSVQPGVLAIAEDIYETRRWSELPVLADALEDTGCTAEEVLTHLRSAGPHALGCWATDCVRGVS